ncbi:hypothetical protein Glove_212g193 [Diversispora epigaea]|uniref:Serine-threonine/tyrosine-protein kinase catalytic domain-containing protein n=1 Tax=Diversispora epigaea TaxID=1348612 RepID=A0A397IR79_9GLOM|nr:hypothetical protein Glove_212g193 [Diversispora epigaea]
MYAKRNLCWQYLFLDFKEIEEIGEMKEMRKRKNVAIGRRREEMEEIGEMKETRKTEELEEKCSECYQDNIRFNWCHAKRFQNEFDKWTRGFGTVYKAKWIDGPIRSWDYKVKIGKGKNAVAIYGITKNPTKNEYMVIMKYAINVGLKNIHEMGLMHKDFHSGEYTQASDIYSFGTVMSEVLTSYPLYYNIPHNENLAMSICSRLKPEIKCEIPQFLKEIMEKCWNFEPLNRPTAELLQN